MAVGFVGDAIELQVTKPEARALGGVTEFEVLREHDAVARALNAKVADISRVLDGVQEKGAQRGLAPRKLHAQLPARLDVQAVIQDLLDVHPRELMDEAYLIGVHEAGITHHVAAVGQVDREHRTSTVLDGRATVIAQFALGRFEVTTRKQTLDARHERGVDADHVRELAVLGTRLQHDDLAIALDDVRLDFTWIAFHELAQVFCAGEHGVAHFFHTTRAKRVRTTGPAELGRGALLLPQERRRRPFGLQATARKTLVVLLVQRPDTIDGFAHELLGLEGNAVQSLLHDT